MKPRPIGIFETKTHLSEIIARVERGEVFVITRRGRPVAELRRYAPGSSGFAWGAAANDAYHMAPDFDEALDDFEALS